MLGDVLCLLRDQVNAFIGRSVGAGAQDAGEARVQLIDGEKNDPLEFRLNAITLLLVNLEQEVSQRSAQAYVTAAGAASPRKLLPDVRMNLFVLFVARFTAYEQGLNQLGLVVRFLQAHRALDHASLPGLSPDIDKLLLEMVTLPMAEQNEIWSALRTNYHPSVLVRVRMVVFRDPEGSAVPQVASTVLHTLQRKPGT